VRNLQGQATSQPGLATHSQCYQANDHQNDDFFDSIGHSRHLKHLAATSAFTLNADIRLRRNICRTGPEAEMTPLNWDVGFTLDSFGIDILCTIPLLRWCSLKEAGTSLDIKSSKFIAMTLLGESWNG